MRLLAFVLALVISFTFLTYTARADANLPQTNNPVATMPRQQLASLLASTNIALVNAAFARLYVEGITYDELAPIFKNPSAQVRLAGLDFLRRSFNADAKAIDLMIPLLRDPDKNVRDADAMVLRSFTGQDIPEDQPVDWEKWWAKYRPYFQLQERARLLAQAPVSGRDYHNRGCINYDLQNFTNALVDFRQACELGSDVTDYSQCRLWLVRARLGDRAAATKDLDVHLKLISENLSNWPWPVRIAYFLVGDITEADLLKEASIPGAEPVAGQLCEAYFYIGAKDLVDGNKKTATKYFRKCVATKLSSFEEYSSAEAELGIPVPPTIKVQSPSP
jgi:tetratricopeptide (TPR) repeat protein